MSDPTEHALQLAMFMQRRDALQFGVVTDGEVTPSWDDSGLAQHEYINDAETILAAVGVLGYVHAPALAKVKADAWDEGYTIGNRHDGRRDANPHREKETT